MSGQAVKDPDLVTEKMTLRRPTEDGPVECPICGEPSGFQMKADLEERPDPVTWHFIETRIVHHDFTFDPCGHMVRIPVLDKRWPSER